MTVIQFILIIMIRLSKTAKKLERVGCGEKGHVEKSEQQVQRKKQLRAPGSG